jgi:hypothetical protein
MYSIEQKFGFCFTREEWDRTFSVDEFVNLIEKKLASPKHAHRYACNRFAQARRPDQLVLQICFVSPIFAVPIIGIRVPPVRWILVALWASLVATFAYSWFKDYGHLKKIVNRTRDATG